MKYILKKIVLTLPVLLFVLSSHADSKLLGVKVRHDKKFDFSLLNNKYQWIKRKDSSREYYAATDPDINEYFLSVVNRNLAAKGFEQTFDGNASFGIDYEVIIKKEGTQASLESTLQDLRKKRYSKTHIPKLPNIENMRAGSVLLNIVDMETGYLIWIGHAEAVVYDKKNREELINHFIARALADFPPK